MAPEEPPKKHGKHVWFEYCFTCNFAHNFVLQQNKVTAAIGMSLAMNMNYLSQEYREHRLIKFFYV